MLLDIACEPMGLRSNNIQEASHDDTNPGFIRWLVDSEAHRNLSQEVAWVKGADHPAASDLEARCACACASSRHVQHDTDGTTSIWHNA